MSVDLSNGHPDMDYDEHRRTYKGFLIGSQVLCVLVAVILIGMAVFLV
ncbi:MAG: aa3-type cytochrome c oxidase subunit IV [Filomicrobium sp.]